MKLFMMIMLYFSISIINCSSKALCIGSYYDIDDRPIYDDIAILKKTLTILRFEKRKWEKLSDESIVSCSYHDGSLQLNNLIAYINNMLRNDELLYKAPSVRPRIEKLLPITHERLLHILRYHKKNYFSDENNRILWSTLADALDAVNKKHSDYKLEIMSLPAKLHNIKLQQ